MTPPNLSANERLVYRVLLERAVGGVVTASLDDLGEASGLSARSITRATKTLQQHNLIRVEYRHSQHGRLTNRYHIVNAPSAQPPLELTDVLEQDATPAQTVDEVSVYELLKPRAEDGYLSATLMCQAYNRKLSHWLENNSTTALVDALSLETGIPTSKLVQIIKGRGDVIQQGTWIHPDLAVQLAQWLDPRFALFVSRLVRSYFSGHRQSQYLELPTDFEGALELSLTLVRMNKDLHNRIATVRAQLEDVINTLDGLEGN